MKIILVEDDQFLRELYAHVLEKEAYNVITAEDGEIAVNQVLANPDASIVLLDVMLPKLNGVEVLKHIRENEATKTIPVLMLTNMGEDSAVTQAKQLGILGYLIKMQYTPKELVDEIKKYLADPNYKGIASSEPI